MKRPRWYFVRHLLPDDAAEYGAPFEIQVLRADGAAIGVGHVRSDTQSLTVHLDPPPYRTSAPPHASVSVPSPVLTAAFAEPPGFGDYVSASGARLDFLGIPISSPISTDPEHLAASLLEGARQQASMGSPNHIGAVRTARGILAMYPSTRAASAAAALLDTLVSESRGSA